MLISHLWWHPAQLNQVSFRREEGINLCVTLDETQSSQHPGQTSSLHLRPIWAAIRTLAAAEGQSLALCRAPNAPGSFVSHGPLLIPLFLPEFWPLRLPKVLLHGHVVPGKPPDKPQRAGAAQREVHGAGGEGRGKMKL